MIRSALLTLARGFAMGAADLVPGVSGGTVALVLGIYERLIASVRAGSRAMGSLIILDVAGFRRWMRTVDWLLMVPLGLGILLAVFALASIIRTLLHDQPVLMASIFLGLVAGSVVVAWRLIRSPRMMQVAVIVAVAVVTFILLGVRGGAGEESVTQAASAELWAYFIAGTIAICAMILPGISGSFLLVMMGMYAPVLAAVTDRDIVTLVVFMAGCVVGLALFSQLLHRLLRTHHDVMLAVLIGLMAGSVRVLWPWPGGVDSTDLGAPEGDVLVPVVAAVIAFLVVAWVAVLAQRLEARDPSHEVRDL